MTRVNKRVLKMSADRVAVIGEARVLVRSIRPGRVELVVCGPVESPARVLPKGEELEFNGSSTKENEDV